jgi:hypothetical protein
MSRAAMMKAAATKMNPWTTLVHTTASMPPIIV